MWSWPGRIRELYGGLKHGGSVEIETIEEVDNVDR